MRKRKVFCSDSVRKILILHVAAAFFALPQTVSGKEAEKVSEMVVTATLTERHASEAPGTVEVITEKDFRSMNASNLADVLEEAAGLSVESESGRVRSPSIRGARTTHTLVLVDGRRLVAGFRDIVDIGQIPLTAVERIEVLRGPGSAIYGSDALGGVVNVITKKAPKSWEAGLAGQYGIDDNSEGDSYTGSVYAGGPVSDRFSFLLSGQYMEEGAWGENRDRSVSDVQSGDETSLESLLGRFSVNAAPGHEISGGFEYSEHNRTGYRWHTGAFRDRIFDDDRLSYYASYRGDLTPTDSILFRLNRSEQKHKTRFDPPRPDDNSGSTENTMNHAEARYTGILTNAHQVTLGLDYREEVSRAGDREKFEMDNMGVYLQDEYQVTEPLLLVGSVRLDRHSEYGSQVTPRVNLLYRIAGNWRLRAAYGEGFRAPSFTEFFAETGRARGAEIVEPNPDLDPEKSRSYEAGIETRYRDVSVNVTAFRNEIRDMIDDTFVREENNIDYYQWQNISEARMQGIEFGSSVTLPYGFSLDGFLTWIDTKDRDTGEKIEGQPEYKSRLKLSYIYPAWQLDFNIRMNYRGRRYYEDGDSGGYTLFNVYLAKGLGEKRELYIGGNNVFDNHPRERPPFYYAGFRFQL